MRMNRNILPQWSLKARVTFATLAIFVISIWALGFYISRMLQGDMERLLDAQQFSTVSILGAGVNQALEERLSALETTAASLSPAMLGNAAALQAFLERRRVLQSLFNAGIFVTRSDGMPIADVPVPAGHSGPDVIDRDCILTALKEGKSSVGRPVIGKTPETPVFSIAAPIRDTRGEVVGVVAGVINLGKPGFIDQITGNHFGRTGDYFLVALRHRLNIISSDKSRIMESLPAPGINPVIDRFIQGYEGSARYIDQHGVDLLVSVRSIPAANWAMVATLPAAEAFAPLRSMQQRILFATIFLTLIAGGLTWWMLRRQLLPLQATSKALVKLSNADRIPQPLPVTGPDEIGQLIGGFNRLLETWTQREAALKSSEERWKFALEGAGEGVWDWNIQTGEALYSKRWKEMIGYAENEIGNDSSEWSRRVHPEDLPKVMTTIQSHLDGKTPSAVTEFRALCRDGSWRWMLGRGMVVSRSSDGKPLRLVGTNTDITQRKQAEDVLRAREEKYRVLVETTGTGYLIIDREGRVIDANPEYVRQTGRYQLRDILGKSVTEWTADYEKDRNAMAVAQCVKEGFIRNLVIDYTDGKGRITPVEINATVIGDGDALRIVSLCRDITERRQMEGQVHQLAFYDPLTRLPNRRLLNDRLIQTMAANKRSGCYGALMFLDLDNFKPLNDHHGHEVGDLLLIEAASRLKSCVREMDTVARFGGDEFVMMVSELGADKDESAAQARIVAEKIRVALSEPYLLTIRHEGRADITVEHHCTASIGVTLFINHEASQDDVIKWADIAMYRAKEAGRNSIRFYDPNEGAGA